MSHHFKKINLVISEISSSLPLVVDLDGTLIKTDLLAETANKFLIENTFRIFELLGWLAQSKSTLKSKLAESTFIDVVVQPYNEELLIWLRAQKMHGRHLVLATASHRILANQVAAHLDLFDEVLSSDEDTNLKSETKRKALVNRYGEGGFDYIGNDWADISVWKSAAQAHVVSNSQRLIEKARNHGNLGITMNNGKPTLLSALFKAMRPHQWIKNLLVFIPILTASKYNVGTSVIQAMLAFLVFGLAASSVYLLNDLVDVNDDRHHPRKRSRPLAAGNLSLFAGWIAWTTLLVLSFTLACFWLPGRFILCLTVYFILTLAYSLQLKQLPIVDVMTLAGLYTMRIIAGAAAVRVPLSFWLLSFSMFIFLSLAFIKRYSELRIARDAGKSNRLRGRGYDQQDLELVASLGSNAGYIAVLVLALYIQDSHTASLYATPKFIWLACPLLMFWISRAWLITHRGNMHDDPIVFALKDRLSWVVIALLLIVFALAKVIK